MNTVSGRHKFTGLSLGPLCFQLCRPRSDHDANGLRRGHNIARQRAGPRSWPASFVVSQGVAKLHFVTGPGGGKQEDLF
jgi:hypothetical protein